MKKFLVPIAAIAVAAFASSAFAAPAMIGNTDKGKVLTDSKGMTLYTFSKDSSSKSACNGKCAHNWPPLMVKAGEKGAEGYSKIKRNDGKMQWAYKGKPLYTFIKDKKVGETKGEGLLNGAWHMAKP